MAFFAKRRLIWTATWPYKLSYDPQLPEPPEVRLEPWREHSRASDVKLLPLWLVERFVDWSRVAQVKAQDRQRLADLRVEIEERGLEEPLVLLVDKFDHIRLYNGHHRFMVCKDLGFSELPILIKVGTGKIGAFSMKVSEELDTLLVGYRAVSDP